MAASNRSTWRKKLKRIFEEQLQDLLINRHVFRQARQAWAAHANPYDGAELAQAMVQTYIAFAATAVRRLAEPRPKNPRKGQRTLSLVILLEELLDNFKDLSRSSYIAQYPKNSIVYPLAGKHFDEIAGRKNSRHMPASRLRADIAKLKRAAAPTKRLVDKVIAHTEEDRRRKGRPTLEKIDKAIDLVVEVYERYHLLLTARSFEPLRIIDDVDVTDRTPTRRADGPKPTRTTGSSHDDPSACHRHRLSHRGAGLLPSPRPLKAGRKTAL